MSQAYTIRQSNFAGGILDEAARGARTSQAYLTGLAKAENVLFWPTGAVFRRRGTRHTALILPYTYGMALKTASFESGGNEYFVAIVAGWLYVYDSRLDLSQLIGTDYADGDITGLDVKACQGDLYIVHRSYPPRRLHSDVSGGVETGCLAATVTVGGVETGEVSIEVEDDAETAVIGETVSCADWTLEDLSFTGGQDFSAEGFRPGVQAFKGGRWIIGSSIAHPDTIWASRPYDDDGNPRFTDFTLADRYVTTTITTRQEKIYEGETKSTVITSSTSSEAPWKEGDVETEYDEDPTDTTETDADGNSYTLRVSKHVKTEFTYKVLSSHAVQLTESDMTGARMNWIAVQARILVGYGRSVWMDGGSAITPETFDLNPTLTIGSTMVPPAALGSLLFFVGMSRRSIVAIGYDDNSGGYTSSEVTRQARSLFTSGIVKLAVLQGEVSLLAALLGDGTVATCCISDGMAGWSLQTFGDGKAVGMDVLHTDSSGDRLALMVRRGTQTGLEILSLASPSDLDGAVFLDNWTTYSADTETTAWTVNDDSYQGAVEMAGDGAAMGSVTPDSDGSLATPVACKELAIGYGYRTVVETLPPELPANGSSVGKRRQLAWLAADLLDSLDFQAGCAGRDLSRIQVPVTLTKSQIEWLYRHKDSIAELSDVRTLLYGISLYGSMDAPFTGRKELPVTGSTDAGGGVDFVIDGPVPWCLVALTAKYTIREV